MDLQQILIVTTTEGEPFAVRRPGAATTHPVGQRLLTTIYREDESLPPGPGTLEIVRDGVGQGFVANLGPHYVRVQYVYKGDLVGPRLDLMAPGTIRELGIGKGVAWRLSMVRP